MTADTAAVLLVACAVPSATLFPVIYAITAPWWKSLLGWGLLVSTTGLGLLVDISILYQWLGGNYALRDAVRLAVYSFVVAGSWILLIAYLRSKFCGSSLT